MELEGKNLEELREMRDKIEEEIETKENNKVDKNTQDEPRQVSSSGGCPSVEVDFE